MVRLDRIYTRGGDDGQTSLGDGTRVPKTHPRIAAYGTVDELNAVLGVALLQRGLAAPDRALLRGVQNDLFDVGADLCVPRRPDEAPASRLRIAPGQVTVLEQAIDRYTDQLEPLRSFIIPGGAPAAAWLHVARVVCRRAELQVAALDEREAGAAGPTVLAYLNRLSDLLFVLARWANGRGKADVLWEPGAGQKNALAPRRRTRNSAPAKTADRRTANAAGSRAPKTAVRRTAKQTGQKRKATKKQP